MRMSFTQPSRVTRIAGVLCCMLALGLMVPGQSAQAQFENKPMAIGDFHQMYNEVGGETEYWWSVYGMEWPARYASRGLLRAGVFWVSRTDFTGPDGEDLPVQIAHVGSRATGFGEYFPQEFTTVSRFEDPEVLVDGLPSNRKVSDVDEVDPEMKYDRKIINTINAINGVTVTRNIYAYSQENHDNYHIHEYVLTNTGNTDGDADIELPDQTATGVYLHLGFRYGYDGGSVHVPGNEWGANVVNDVVGDGLEQYETDLRAQYTWLGNSPGAEYDPIGGPIMNDQFGFAQEGDDARLTAAQIVGTAAIHAPAEPGGPDADNLNATSASELQPSVTGYIGADHGLLSANDPFNVPKMQREFDMMSGGWAEADHGHMPHHANVVDADGNFLTPQDQGDPKLADSGGQQAFHSYGPYTLEPGESVRIVQVVGADGLDRQEAIHAGREFKALVESTGDGFTQQTFSLPSRPDVSLSKNGWVLSGKDSLFATFEKAIAGWESDSPVQRAPLPPSRFEVTSGVGNISLSWTAMDGGPERTGWEIYRSKNDWEGSIDNMYEYERIATLPPGETSYQDNNVQRGIEYYYHVKAVGAESDYDGPGALRSNRHYTQTYTPASLKRPPGTLDDVAIVPNPYVIGAEESVAWPEENRLAFLEIPGQSTIEIFTESGELVKTIEHTDGSGDEFWRLQTESRQIISSGVYIAVITNNETGETAIKKFSVVR